jgi:hypothetical protein
MRRSMFSPDENKVLVLLELAMDISILLYEEHEVASESVRSNLSSTSHMGYHDQDI